MAVATSATAKARNRRASPDALIPAQRRDEWSPRGRASPSGSAARAFDRLERLAEGRDVPILVGGLLAVERLLIPGLGAFEGRLEARDHGVEGIEQHLALVGQVRRGLDR